MEWSRNRLVLCCTPLSYASIIWIRSRVLNGQSQQKAPLVAIYFYTLVITSLYNLCKKIIDGLLLTAYNEAITGCSHEWAESKLML